jgi:peptidoglycan/LPS O-acetylase OafA/YrhL
MFPIISATGAWLTLVILAIINGAIREKYINLHIGQQKGHIISSIVFCIVILFVTYFYVLLFSKGYGTEAMIDVGIYWLALTVAFEFVFGHYVAGHSWERLLADYNIFNGRIWIIVLITTFFAPLVCYNFITR